MSPVLQAALITAPHRTARKSLENLSRELWLLLWRLALFLGGAHLTRNQFPWVPGGVIARLTLKGVCESESEPAAEYDSTRGSLPGPDIVRDDRLKVLS